MLNLETILGSGDALLPSEGVWGFLLDHWMIVGVVAMVVGFLIDQALYMVRYRPQDSWRAAYFAFRRFLTERFGVKPAEEPPEPEAHNPLEHSGMTERREEPERSQPAPSRAQQRERVPLRDEEGTALAPPQRPHSAPVRQKQAGQPAIRRGGAQYSPRPAHAQEDGDEPLVVRAAHIPPPVSAEPITKNGNDRTEKTIDG